MNPYVLTVIIFSVILGIVYLVVSIPRTIYLPNMNENSTESIEARKERAAKIKSRTFVFSIGGVVAACLLTMLIIAISGPVKKVQAALNPSATPTMTNTVLPTSTHTPRPTMTRTPTSEANFLTSLANATGGTPSKPGAPTATRKPSSFVPSSGDAGGGQVITVIQTRVVNVVQTRVVMQYIYQIQTQLVPVTVIVVVTATPLPATATVDSPTPTFTPTLTETPSETPTETPSPTPTETETPIP